MRNWDWPQHTKPLVIPLGGTSTVPDDVSWTTLLERGMKDQYFGDVHDFRKYGLLRILADRAQLQIGVVWMRTGPDRRSDGQKRVYLQKESEYREYDPCLFDALRRLLRADQRPRISLAKQWDLVPGACLFDELLERQVRLRQAYFERAFAALGHCDVLFFDPDNGIEVPSSPRVRVYSPKHIYWTELQEAFARRHSLVIYQHFPRPKGGRDCYIRHKQKMLQERLETPSVFCLKTSHVVFFLVPRQNHSQRFGKAIERIIGCWHGQIMPT